MSDFDSLLNSIIKTDEIKIIQYIGKQSKENERKIIDFIKANNIDCNHLWEDGEEGDKSTDDWHKLAEYALSL